MATRMTQVDGQALARFAAVLADRTRATMCLALLDGQAWTAGELARLTGVAPATASGHLTRLVEAGLVTEQRQGRHRYVRLSGPTAAELIEALTAHTGPVVRVRSLRAANAAAALARGRTCYDHLAGRLGVALTDVMDARGLISRRAGWSLTGAGSAWLAEFGVDMSALSAGQRPMLRECLDWTEQRPHLAGAVGAALCRHLLALAWIERVGAGRAVRVTPAGRQGLRDSLGFADDWHQPGTAVS
jgi:DNA-binding transcriptional ArsR family regulator